MYDDILGPRKSSNNFDKKEDKYRKSVNSRIIDDTIKLNKMKANHGKK